LPVEPKAFVEIEDGVPSVDRSQLEKLKNFLEREHLAVVLGRPAEQAEVVADRFRRVTALDKVGHARAAIPLAEFFSFVIQDQGNVSVGGRFGSKRVVQLDVFRRIRKVIFAADDVGDLHLQIIDHIHKVKNPRAIGSADRHVRMGPWVGHIEFNAAADQVFDNDGLSRRAKADRSLVRVNMPAYFQSREVPFIDVVSLALKIRSEVSSFVGAFIPVQVEPFQSLVNGLHRLGGVPLLIGIFDS
jgi:hypothetical protein